VHRHRIIKCGNLQNCELLFKGRLKLAVPSWK